MRRHAQISVLNEEGKEAMSALAESELGELASQGAYLLPADAKTRLLPAALNGGATVVCSLNGGGGLKPWEAKGPLQLLEGKKKQWLQVRVRACSCSCVCVCFCRCFC